MAKRSILCGTLGGVVLCLLFILVSFLPYLENQDFLIPLIVLGGIAVASVLLDKNCSFKHTLLRSFLLFFCCIITTRVLAFLGIIETISSILPIQESEANNRAAGIGMMYFLVILLGESIIINGIQLARSLIKRKGT